MAMKHDSRRGASSMTAARLRNMMNFAHQCGSLTGVQTVP
jgi:hypothetical protein